MAPKPRGRLNQHGIPNLYVKLDKRTGKHYAQYRDPRNGKCHGLGADMDLAKERAKQLNALIYKQMQDHRVSIILENRPAKSNLTMSGWLVGYRKILDERKQSGEIAENTWKEGQNRANVIERQFGHVPLRSVEVKQIADWLKTYKAADKSSMGANLRKWLVDIFVEAIQAGECEDNPAEKTAKIKFKVKRARLTLETFKTILAAAEGNFDPWVANSMLLSLVTGQAREEVNRMRFQHVQDGYLEIVRKKTGARIKIPVALTMAAMGISVDSIIRRCRDDVVSPHILHHTRTTGGARKGDAIHIKTISEKFSEARHLSGLSWGEHTPPTFHEIRSLSGRLYKAQGIDTQSLWGHKRAQTSEDYHDARGHDWVVVKI